MAKPKLALIPAAQGSKFYSVLPSSGVGDFDFTRSGSATRINSQGLIESVASGVSRLNYPMIDGVVKGCPHHILEPQRSNLFTNSENYSIGWSLNQLVVDVNDVISPNGTLNADFISENTTINPHFMFQSVGTTTTSDYTISIFAKHNSRILQIFAGGGDVSNNPYANFDLENGVLNNNGCNDAFIEDYGNGWFRCGVIVTSAVTSGFNPCFGLVNTLNSSRAFSYQGDGTSGIYVWGAMLESGSYKTSYIKTTSAAVTRSAETANGSGDAATFNDSEGVLMVEISALADDLVAEGISISDETIGNRVVIFKWTTTNSIKVRVASGGTNYFDKTISVSDITTINKIAIKYKQNDFSLWLNGIELETDTSGITPIGLSKLNFNGATSPSAFYGNTKQIQYYDSALTDSELETLTSWVSFSDMAEGQLYTIE
jgi:hypothetical protein